LAEDYDPAFVDRIRRGSTTGQVCSDGIDDRIALASLATSSRRPQGLKFKGLKSTALIYKIRAQALLNAEINS